MFITIIIILVTGGEVERVAMNLVDELVAVACVLQCGSGAVKSVSEAGDSVVQLASDRVHIGTRLSSQPLAQLTRLDQQRVRLIHVMLYIA